MVERASVNELFTLESPIGWITAERTKSGISRIDILDAPVEAHAQPNMDDLWLQFRQQLGEYFEGRRKEFSVLLDWSSMTKFQAEVLRLTLAIPYGEVRTYGNLANALGKPAASRAVGGALARNPLPLVIPCHRVIASSGALTGYTAAGGITTKAWLLKLEGHNVVGEKLD